MPIVTIGAEKREYAFGTPFQEIVKDYQEGIENDILLVSADGKLKELHKTLKEDCELRLITAADRAGFLSYQRSALFLMLKAFYDIAGKDNVSKLTVCFSMGNGLYIEPEGALALTRELLDRVKMPKKITNVIYCKNPRCITSIEQELPHIFYLADEKKETYRCQYCEEKYSK